MHYHFSLNSQTSHVHFFYTTKQISFYFINQIVKIVQDGKTQRDKDVCVCIWLEVDGKIDLVLRFSHVSVLSHSGVAVL